MDGLLAPAWVVALATAGFLGAMAVVKIRGANGTNGEAKEITRALQTVTITLSALTERLQQLPTREDLKDVTTESRHEYRNIIAGECGQVREQVVRTEDRLVGLLERHA